MSDSHFSLINVGDLSKPADTLIKKISSAVGILYEPTRIRNRAKAESDAEKIRALARADLTAIEERAIERLVHQEARRQQNIEEITAQTLTQLGEDARPEKLDEDWLTHFFMKCQNVSDNEMQSLWARILAGEATKPSTFSKRTIEFVSTMDKKDAELFTKLGQFVWDINGPTSVLFDVSKDVFAKEGVLFSELKHLDSIGVLDFSELSSYKMNFIFTKMYVNYFDSQVLLEFKNNKNEVELGRTMLTEIGRQLFPVCGASRNEGAYFDTVLDKWRASGVNVTLI